MDRLENYMTEQEYKEIIDNLKSMADEKYRQFHQRLVPNVDNLLGVQVPKIKTLAKEIAKHDYKGFLRYNSTEYYEEIMLRGLVIGYIKADIEEVIGYIEEFVLQIDNWGVCDSFCANLKITVNNKERVLELIEKYLKSDREFELRFAIVMLLDFYIDKEHLLYLFDVFNSTNHEGYYVKMAVAWAISICYIKYKSETKIFLEENCLDDFTYNKAIQKIIESNRILKEEKIELKNLKRK